MHKWSSIICTLFLLMLCATGLPLVFHEEIDALIGRNYEATLPGPASAESGLPLDAVLARALAQRPGEVPLSIAFSRKSPLLTITTGPSRDASSEDMTRQFFDRATGESLGKAPRGGVMNLVVRLHVDFFTGRPGRWFLGAMGGLFVIALLSGAVLYVPFMGRLGFGTLRTRQSKRVGWLDQHNLLGIVTLAWALVVGITGMINAFADPLVKSWRDDALVRMTADYGDAAPVPPSEYGSLDRAMASARSVLPGHWPQLIVFPGGERSTGHHYAVFFQGDQPLTKHLLMPALIDARTGEFTASARMPAMNRALMKAKPLHFGDYGGVPLKLLWALLDLATIWVLWTGLLLWLRRSPARIERRIEEIASGGQPAAGA